MQKKSKKSGFLKGNYGSFATDTADFATFSGDSAIYTADFATFTVDFLPIPATVLQIPSTCYESRRHTKKVAFLKAFIDIIGV